jgi:hypothetical protein
MDELKEEWNLKDRKNKAPFVTYNAYVKNLRETIIAQLR